MSGAEAGPGGGNGRGQLESAGAVSQFSVPDRFVVLVLSCWGASLHGNIMSFIRHRDTVNLFPHTGDGGGILQCVSVFNHWQYTCYRRVCAQCCLVHMKSLSVCRCDGVTDQTARGGKQARTYKTLSMGFNWKIKKPDTYKKPLFYVIFIHWIIPVITL